MQLLAMAINLNMHHPSYFSFIQVKLSKKLLLRLGRRMRCKNKAYLTKINKLKTKRISTTVVPASSSGKGVTVCNVGWLASWSYASKLNSTESHQSTMISNS
jgi:hypothetical protein